MRKLIPFFLVSSALHALPIGNPSEPALMTDGIFCQPALDYCTVWDRFSYRLGFYGDYVFDRNLEKKRSGDSVTQSEIYTNAAYFALGFCNRIDLFATLGATSIDLTSDNMIFGDPFSSGVSTATEFSWSIGGRALAWRCGCFGLGVEGQYFSTKPKVGPITRVDGIFVNYVPNVRAIYDEWQVGAALSYRLNIFDSCSAFVPYVGVKWAGCELKLGNEDILTPTGRIFLPDFESSRLWGYGVGVTFVGSAQFAVTAEGRFGDEKALYINGQARF